MQETWVQFLGWEDPLEKGLTTHSSMLAWEIRGAWLFLKHLSNLLQYYFCFIFWVFGYEACGILAP